MIETVLGGMFMENIRFHITVKGIVVYHQKVLLMKRVRPSTDGLGCFTVDVKFYRSYK